MIIENIRNIFKKAPKKGKITEIIPKDLEIYDIAFLELEHVEVDKIDPKALDHYFQSSVSTVYTISGDIVGQVICQLDSYVSQKFQSDLEGMLEITDIFIKSSHMVLEEIIKNIEEEFDIMGHISSPLVFGAGKNEREKNYDHIKKMRILSLINTSLSKNQFFQVDYALSIGEYVIPLHLFLVLNIKECEVNV